MVLLYTKNIIKIYHYIPVYNITKYMVCKALKGTRSIIKKNVKTVNSYKLNLKTNAIFGSLPGAI